jgi:hypothetical protein
MLATGGLAAVTAAPAFADVTTANYTIGTPTGAVTSATVSPTTVVANSLTSWTVSFVTPAALGSGATVTIADDASNAVAGSTNVGTAYLLSGSCLQTGTATASTGNPLVITINCSSGISAGATVQVVFNATSPSSNFYFEVSTSANSTAVDTSTVTVSSAPPTLSASTLTPGAGAVYSISGIGGAGATNALTGTNSPSAQWSNLTGSASVIELTSNAITWYSSGPGGYSVTYTAPSSTAASDPVTAINTQTAGHVYLQLTSSIPVGSTVNITADGTNPASAGTSTSVYVYPYAGSVTSGSVSTTPVGNTTDSATAGVAEESGSVTFGNPVTSPTLSLSSTTGGATGVTYTVTFITSAAVAASSGTISISETTGPTNFSAVSGVLVSDATDGWHIVATKGTGPGTFSGTSGGDLTVTLGANAISSGAAVSLTIIGVTNPANGTYSDFDVSTSGNPVSTAVASYTLVPSGVAAPQVTVNPNTTGSVATYTITGLYATANLTGGSTANEIALTAPAGTVFPNVSSDYMVSDSTTSSGSGTFTLQFYSGSYVILVPPNNINSGDALTITIEDVINPSTASSTYSLSFAGDIGQASTATFPDANVTYPNGAIVNFSGTMYVFAGGHAFGVPTPKILNAVKAVDPATVVKAGTGAKVPTASLRSGTLVTTNAVNGTPTIYVMGTDGDLHGFSTPAQLLSDGYNAALNVTVPNLAGLTVGTTVGQSGSAVTALATASDGALINSSGTIYVLAGGRAFGIPGPKALSAIRLTDHATVQSGTVSTTLTSQSLTNGVLVTANKEVYVTYNGYLWPFKTMKQLMADGYGGTASVPVVFTSTNKPGIVSAYAGY